MTVSFRDDTDGFLRSAAREARGPLGEDIFSRLVDQVRRRTTEVFPGTRLLHPDHEVEEAIRDFARDAVRGYQQEAIARGWPLLEMGEDEAIRRIAAEILGLGEIEDLLRQDGVEDIVVNGPGEVCFFRGGVWYDTGIRFEDEEHALRVLNRAMASTGRQVSRLSPVVDATIPGGHRINVVMSPCAEPSPCAAIRVRRRGGFSLLDFVGKDMREAVEVQRIPEIPDYSRIFREGAMLTPQAATFLHMAVLAGANIVVVGGTGVGKTSFLGALGRLIPPWLRILAIEDTRELNLRPADDGKPHNCVYFITRPESLEGTPAVDQAMLVRAALRQRPNALTLGEARGGEILDLLKALRTGHRNGLTSIHADGINELVSRVKLMLQEAVLRTEVSDTTVAEWIAGAFNLAIFLEMASVVTPEGIAQVRRVTEVVEFTGGVEGGQPLRQTLFRYDPRKGYLARENAFPSDRLQRLLTAGGFNYQQIQRMDPQPNLEERGGTRWR